MNVDLPDHDQLLFLPLPELRAALKKFVVSNPLNFSILMEFFLREDYRISQRLAGTLAEQVKKNPAWLNPYHDLLLQLICKPVLQEGRLRNILRLLALVNLDENKMGLLVERCFELLSDPRQPVAVRVFSIKNILNYRKEYPELVEEIKLSIPDPEDSLSPGIKSVLRKL